MTKGGAIGARATKVLNEKFDNLEACDRTENKIGGRGKAIGCRGGKAGVCGLWCLKRSHN